VILVIVILALLLNDMVAVGVLLNDGFRLPVAVSGKR